MNANKVCSIVAGMVLAFCTTAVLAEQGLDASSQTKVNSAKAKMWTNSENKNPIEKRSVNMGSKSAGTCGVNVGTAKSGEKAPKNIVVTTKDVINICK